MKNKTIFLIIILCLIAGAIAAFFFFSSSDSQPEGASDTVSKEERKEEGFDERDPFFDSAGQPIAAPTEHEGHVHQDEQAPMPSNTPGPDGEFKNLFARKFLEQQNEMISLAKQHCKPAAATKFEGKARCVAGAISKDAKDPFDLAKLQKCDETYDTNDDDLLICGITVQQEKAKKHCNPQEVNVIMDFSECLIKGINNLGTEPSEQIMAKEVEGCMSKHKLDNLSPKCAAGFGGMDMPNAGQ